MNVPYSSEFHKFIRSRRSVRRFTDQIIPEALIERLIATAASAPSAHNRQPWRFVVLRSPQTRIAIAEAMGSDFHDTLLSEGRSHEDAVSQVQRSYDRITQAPAAALLCLDTSTLDRYDDSIRDQGEYTMAVQSVAMAGAGFLLAAHAEGLGAVWMCAPLFTPQTVQNVLDLSSDWLPQGLILLGYPSEPPKKRPHLDFESITIIK